MLHHLHFLHGEFHVYIMKNKNIKNNLLYDRNTKKLFYNTKPVASDDRKHLTATD